MADAGFSMSEFHNLHIFCYISILLYKNQFFYHDYLNFFNQNWIELHAYLKWRIQDGGRFQTLL